MTDYDLMYNTIKLYLKNNGEIVKTASGFFFKNNNKIFIITNKHVITDIDELMFVFHQSFEIPGKVRNFSIGGSDINRIINIHQTFDLCAIEVTQYITKNDKFKFLCVEDIIDETKLNYDKVLQNIFVIGYPVGIEDELNKLPIFTSGTTASNLLIDYNGIPEILLNVLALPGSSGSPVFTEINGKRKLIGIIYSIKIMSSDRLIDNLCLAIKSQIIKEIIN